MDAAETVERAVARRGGISQRRRAEAQAVGDVGVRRRLQPQVHRCLIRLERDVPVARVQAFDDGPVRPVDRGLGLEPRLGAGVAEVHVDLELDAVPAPARRRVSGDPKPRRRPRRAPHLARDHRFQVLRPGHPERHRLSRHLPAGGDQRGSPAVHRRDDALADEAIDAHFDQGSVVVHGSPVRSQVRGRWECRPSRRRTGRAVRGTTLSHRALVGHPLIRRVNLPPVNPLKP